MSIPGELGQVKAVLLELGSFSELVTAHSLIEGITTLGSLDSNDIILKGLLPLHVVFERNGGLCFVKALEASDVSIASVDAENALSEISLEPGTSYQILPGNFLKVGKYVLRSYMISDAPQKERCPDVLYRVRIGTVNCPGVLDSSAYNQILASFKKHPESPCFSPIQPLNHKKPLPRQTLVEASFDDSSMDCAHEMPHSKASLPCPKSQQLSSSQSSLVSKSSTKSDVPFQDMMSQESKTSSTDALGLNTEISLIDQHKPKLIPMSIPRNIPDSLESHEARAQVGRHIVKVSDPTQEEEVSLASSSILRGELDGGDDSSEETIETANIVSPGPPKRKRVSSPSMDQRAPSKRPKSTSVPLVVMMTGIKQDAKYKRLIKKLGLCITEEVKQCTHLIAEKILRTPKFLAAISFGKVIVSLSWIEYCSNHGICNPLAQHLLYDAEGEKTYSFCLEESLQRARANLDTLLYSGYSLYMSPRVPKRAALGPIFAQSGAIVVLLQFAYLTCL